jgi:hypothetical protein
VIAGLLRRLWRSPSAPHSFRPLSAMTEFWSNETLADIAALARYRTGSERALRLLQDTAAQCSSRGSAGNRPCMRATSFGRRESRGSLSIPSPSSAIRHTTRRSTYSTVPRECVLTQMRRSVALRICWA